jgi:hypothetical protein
MGRGTSHGPGVNGRPQISRQIFLHLQLLHTQRLSSRTPQLGDLAALDEKLSKIATLRPQPDVTMNIERSTTEAARPKSKRKHNKVAAHYPDFTEGREEEHRPSKIARTKYSRKPIGTLQQNGALVRSLVASDQASESDTAPPLSIRKTGNARNRRVASASARASRNTAKTSSASPQEAAKHAMSSVGPRRGHRAGQDTPTVSPLLASQKRVNVKTLLEVRIPARKPAETSIRRLNVKTLLEVHIPTRKLAKDTSRK